MHFTSARLYKPLIFALCLLPLAQLTWGLFSGALQPNPVEALLHGAGDWALRLLLVTLAVTPLKRITGWRRPMLWRRMLGLFSFFCVFHANVTADSKRT